MSIPSTSSRGFTLIELVMVLTILSVLSVLAIRKVGDGAAEARRAKSDRILEDLAEAIVGDPFAQDGVVRDREGAVINTSFLSDVGRLPHAWPRPDADPGDEDAIRTLTLAELFVKPQSADPSLPTFVLPFNYYPATTNFFAPGVDPKLADEKVLVPCGWRGPYLRMTSGDSDVYLSDGWKRPFTARRDEFVGASGECEARILPEDFGRWRDSSGTVFVAGTVMSNGFEIAFVRHLGDDKREEVTRERQEEVSHSPDRSLYQDRCLALWSNTCARIAVEVNCCSTNVPVRYDARIYGAKDGWVGAWASASVGATNRFARLIFDERLRIPIGRKILQARVVVVSPTGGRTNIVTRTREVILPKRGCEFTLDVYD